MIGRQLGLPEGMQCRQGQTNETQTDITTNLPVSTARTVEVEEEPSQHIG
jgi:hypothetical protein